jgi:CubicO group peptidase (beta-lactamase class C family)
MNAHTPDSVPLPSSADGPGVILQSMLGKLASRHRVPGIAVSLNLGPRQITATAGLWSSRDVRPASVTDRAPMSCVMKMLVSLLILHGDETGRIRLEDDVAEYLPALSRPNRRTGITVRHLLTHTAGYIEPQQNSARWGFDWERFVEFFPGRKQAFEPGSVFSYCHTGIAILGKVVEVAFGKPVETLLDELVWEPLGMDAPLFESPRTSASPFINLHVRSPKTAGYEPMRPPEETGFLRYSISDHTLSAEQLGRLAAFLAGGLKAETPLLEAARSRLLDHAIDLPVYLSGEEGEAMPLAFCNGVADYGWAKGYNGSYVGSTCALRFDEEAGVGVAAVVNAWAPYVRDMALEFAGGPYLKKRPRPRSPQVIPVGLHDLEGEYEGLMLGSANTVLTRAGDGLACVVHRKGAPDLSGVIEQRDGALRLVAGSREIAIAIATAPGTGLPYLMVGTSACRKIS